MDYGALALVLSIIVIVVLFSFFRGRGGVRHHPEVVQFLLFDVKLNQVLVDTFHQREKPRRLEKTNWEINKSKISFLGESLKETLKLTFAMVEEVNQDLKMTKKNKSLSYQDINVSKLKEPLARCREGLEEWLMDTIGTTEVSPRYPSLSGFMFGER
jgi:hypothetical protein